MKAFVFIIAASTSSLVMCAAGSEETRTKPHLPKVATAAFVETLSSDEVSARGQRVRFLDAWQTRDSFGLRRTQHSVEGTPIHIYLVTEAGELSLITDYTEDPYSTRQVYVAHPVAVEIGPPKPEELHPLRAWFPPDQVFLRCRMPSGEVEFF